jgi:hypothetical protein
MVKSGALSVEENPHFYTRRDVICRQKNRSSYRHGDLSAKHRPTLIPGKPGIAHS